MNVASIIVLILIVAVVALAITGSIISRNKGECNGCGDCPYSDTCKKKK